MVTARIADVWFRKLARLVDLNNAEREALAALPFTLEKTSANRYLVKEGEKVTRCCLLVKGYVARHKMNREGKRQIVSFHMPGDMVDLQHSLLPTADHNIQTMTAATVAWVPIPALAEVASLFPRVAAAFAKDALIDASVFREWVLNVGARDAKTRIAHMLCEFLQRREALGIATAEALDLPFTQEQIGDATGLTSVHVNRMLRELVEDGAFTRIGRTLRVSNWHELKAIADFDPAYLHQAA
jgi:CRP-like cAMP-binding protein